MRQTRIERVTFRLPRIVSNNLRLQSDALPTELLALVHVGTVELAIVAVASLTAGCIWRVDRRYGVCGARIVRRDIVIIYLECR